MSASTTTELPSVSLEQEAQDLNKTGRVLMRRAKQMVTAAEAQTELTMPIAEEAEKGVLEILMMANPEDKMMARAIELGLTYEFFFIPSHRTIFAAMNQMHLNGEAMHPITLQDYLKKQHKLEAIGGPVAIAEIINNKWPSVMFSQLVEELRVVKFKRETLKKADQLSKMAMNGATLADLDEAIDNFERANSTPQPFTATPSGLIYRKPGRMFDPERLTNFTARIISEQIEDDGSLEEQRVFEIECDLEGRKHTVRVPSSKFSAMAWPTAMIGARAIVFPSKGEMARAAIQSLSRDIRQTTIYMHTGWRQIDGIQSYLHGAGAITPTGNRTDVTVRLPESLRYYRLPEPANTPEEIEKAYETVLIFKRTFKPQLTVPLIGGVWASILGGIDYSIYFTGQSGTRKSELSAMGQAFFGSGFHRMALPANWGQDSAIALMLKAFRAKDAVLTIDDFAPNGQKNHDDKLHAKAEDVLRSAGNGSGRTTAKVDHTERAGKPPRGLMFASGEEIPKGLSLQNRLLIVPVQLGDIPDSELSMIQLMAGEGKLAMANAVWIQHVAKFYPTVIRRFNRRRIQFRDQLCSKNKAHARQPTTIAHLIAAWYAWISSGVVNGVFDRQLARKMRKEIWLVMTGTMEGQKEQHTTIHPAEYFLELLRSSLLSGRAHLATVQGLQPEGDSHLYGWRSGVQQGELAGWIHEGLIYLEPGSAYNAANKQGMAQGEGLPVAKKTLWKRMDEKNLLALKEAGFQARVPINRVYAIVIAKESLFP